jgi:hypothetical protein
MKAIEREQRATRYPTAETSPSHDVTHQRVFDYSRLPAARRVARLTVEQVSKRLAEEARRADEEWSAGWPEQTGVLRAWEAGVAQAPAWAIFALASIYGVSMDAFSECFTCRKALIAEEAKRMTVRS